MADAIAVCGLRKSYGKTVALDRLDLSVATGEVHGFLGPNGSGKTTTIRILLGLLRADGGSARLLGGDPWSEATSLHRRLAYVPGVHGLDVEGSRVRCEVDTEKLDGLLRQLTVTGVRSLTSQPPTLEELFLRHYAGDGPAAGSAAGQNGVPA